MIPKDIIIKTIEDFDNKSKKLNEDLNNETKETWTLEKFQEWQKYDDAWKKLEDIIEFYILPLSK